MKKTFLSLLALMCMSLGANAQVKVISDLELGQVDTLSNVLSVAKRHAVSNNDEETKKKSWKRKTFFRLSYNKDNQFNALSDGLEDIFKAGNELKLDGQYSGKAAQNYQYTSDMAASLQWGRNISLHKKAIGNMVKIALDYTWIDLNWNQYKSTYTTENKYNSDLTLEGNTGYDKEYYAPWGTKKNEFNYGMSLGPSITLAPFGMMDNKNLMGIHLQAYYHVGYSASVALLGEDDGTGVGNNVIMWGTGMNTSWGINFSYKAIGIGMEKRGFSKIKYKSFNSELGGDYKYPFEMKQTRFYVTFNF